MTIPDVSLTIKDGALGVLPPSGNNVLTLMGICSSGTANSAYTFGDIGIAKDTLGTGPLVEAVCAVLREAGGSVRAVKIAGTTAAAVSAVTAGSGNTGLSVLTTTSTSALDTYSVKVLVVAGGTNPAAGTATIRVSLDNGLNYGPTVALPTSGAYTVPNTGVVLNFSAATLVAADTYTFTTTAPSFSTSEFNTSYDAAVLDQTADFFGIGLIGVPADATAAQGFFSAFDTKLAGSATLFRYIWGAMQSHSASDAQLKTDFASLTSTSKRLSVATGTARLQSAVGAYQTDRPLLYSMLARAALAPPSEDLGRVASGALLGVTALSRNEALTNTLDDFGFCTARTHIGLGGFYLTNGNLLTDPSSDYQYVQHRRVMDIACKLTRMGMLKFLNDSVRVKTSDGTILEADARRIENYVEGIVRAGTTQLGYASDVSIAVIRTDNILSTSTLRVTIRLIPLGYLKAIDVTIGFFNPQLAPQKV